MKPSQAGPTSSGLQDSSGSSVEYWPVLSWQVTSGRSSSQCAPDSPNDRRWNDTGNDMPLLGQLPRGLSPGGSVMADQGRQYRAGPDGA
jgi:hypothetical protein